MKYTSTRDSKVAIESASAILRGISSDGGLFLPVEMPRVDAAFIEELIPLSYDQRAKKILSLFLTDYTDAELEEYTRLAYRREKFPVDGTAPVVSLPDGKNVLELWHGPTCAFKDMALQILPYLLTGAAKKANTGMQTLILVATSGDTGKAALEGFSDVPGTKILVFYPDEGVSPMQKLQMTSQTGENVGVYAIRGNFDDAQTAVKKIFTDPDMQDKLASEGWAFSSANSINWGRLVPQIVYYFSAYCDLVKAGRVAMGEEILIDVPTGNFGDILAGYYAYKCGLPVKRFICASNANNVLTEFLKTGHYSVHRHFYTTISPSMDILISSNLERLLFDLSGKNDGAIRALYASLAANGEFDVGQEMAAELERLFYAECCDDDETKAEIAKIFREDGYLVDTHTAVACGVYEKYLAETGDRTPCVIASTADPYKFTTAVLDAVTDGKNTETDEWKKIDLLGSLTDTSAPASIMGLRGREVRFGKVLDAAEMGPAVLDFVRDSASARG